MGRIRLYLLLICLLCLSPVWSLAQSLTQYEYWFDDDFGSRTTVGLSGYEADIDVGIDARTLGNGLHWFRFRVLQSDGMYSPVTSSMFFKMQSSNGAFMEYWFDDDRTNINTVRGSVSAFGDALIFSSDLNLKDVSPGFHRMYYRFVNANGTTCSAVSMTPVMVKSRYAEGGSDAPTYTVTAYSIAVDGQQVEGRSFSDPQGELEMTHQLDTRGLAAGEHTLQAKFWNSANATTSLEQKFTVAAREKPALTLTVEEKDGLVTLQFQPVPNDVRYRIVRTDANGAKAKVDGKEGSSYPDMVTFVDNPAAGAYTYYVQTAYTDYDGTQHAVTSNEVAVSVEEPQTEIVAAQEFGYIVGSISCDKNTPMISARVKFSDGVTVSAPLGRFSRTRIAAGTRLTMTVEGDDTHKYLSETVTVKAGLNSVVINGTLRPEYRTNNLENDLGMNSAVELTMEDERHYAMFKVKNLSHTNDWQGIVRVKVISKEKADGMAVGVADMEYETKNLYVGETTISKIGYNATQTVKVFLSGLRPKKDTEFYLYFESEGKWIGTQSPVATKPIGTNSECDMAENPVVRTIGKTGGDNPQWDDDARRDFTAFVVGSSSLIPGVDGNAGDLSSFYSEMLSLAKKISGVKSDDMAIRQFFEWMAGKSVWEVMNEPSVKSVTAVLYDIYANVRSYGSGTMLQKYWNDVLGASYDYGSAQLIIGNLALVAHAAVGKDPIEATVASASVIYSLFYPTTSAGAVPYAAMMYTYTVIGRAMVAKLMEYKTILYNAYLADRLKANKPYTGDKTGSNANRQNEAIDIKLVVKTGKKAKTAIDFTQADAQRQVGDIILWAHNNPAYDASSFHFTPVYMKDGIMLRCNDAKGADLLNKGMNLDKLSLEVNWSNGRQTFIPLNEACDGISIDMGDAPNSDDSFEQYKPATYTITLTTTTGKDHMAEEFYLGNNMKRE